MEFDLFGFGAQQITKEENKSPSCDKQLISDQEPLREHNDYMRKQTHL